MSAGVNELTHIYMYVYNIGKSKKLLIRVIKYQNI